MRHLLSFFAAWCGLLAACSTPPARDISSADLEQALSERAATIEQLEQALIAAAVEPLAVPVPSLPARSELAWEDSDFWQACAFAWNPTLRQARRNLNAARALQDSEGRPREVELFYRDVDPSDGDAEKEVAATFDLLGLLGLGPYRAAKELARSEVRLAFAELESSVWAVRFEVARARARFAAEQERAEAMQALHEAASPEHRRVEILARRGWISPSMLQEAEAVLHGVEHRHSMALQALAREAAELARLCGLDAEHPALQSASSNELESLQTREVDWREPSGTELAEALPVLRASKLSLALAESMLQSEARSRWPSIRIGPMARFEAGDSFLGGMLGIDVPFPGALDGRVAAARERRDASLEALEDGLVAARARIIETKEVLTQALKQRDEHMLIVDSAADRALKAATAEFHVDALAMPAWIFALSERAASASELIDARANALLAALDYEEARGPAPDAGEMAVSIADQEAAR